MLTRCRLPATDRTVTRHRRFQRRHRSAHAVASAARQKRTFEQVGNAAYQANVTSQTPRTRRSPRSTSSMRWSGIRPTGSSRSILFTVSS